MGHIGAGENDDHNKISPRPAVLIWSARAHHPHRGGEFFGGKPVSELITNQYADPTPTTAPNRKLAQLNALIDQIAQLFPGHSGEIGVSVSTGCGYRSLTLHGVQAYSTATELMRSLGIQTRRKQIIQSETPWVN